MAKNKKRTGLIVFFVLIAILAVLITFFGKSIYDKLHREYLLSTYPLKYSELVEKYAGDNNIDKNLVYAIVKTESGFDEKAESSVGARGLMQIMEITFDTVKGWVEDDENQTFDDMYSAEQNLRYGCFLIGYLLRYYDGNEELAVCAYHAGTGNVDAWLENKEYSKDGKTLLFVPTNDTAHYLDKITNAKANYIELYNTEE